MAYKVSLHKHNVNSNNNNYYEKIDRFYIRIPDCICDHETYTVGLYSAHISIHAKNSMTVFFL